MIQICFFAHALNAKTKQNLRSGGDCCDVVKYFSAIQWVKDLLKFVRLIANMHATLGVMAAIRKTEINIE